MGLIVIEMLTLPRKVVTSWVASVHGTELGIGNKTYEEQCEAIREVEHKGTMQELRQKNSSSILSWENKPSANRADQVLPQQQKSAR